MDLDPQALLLSALMAYGLAVSEHYFLFLSAGVVCASISCYIGDTNATSSDSNGNRPLRFPVRAAGIL